MHRQGDSVPPGVWDSAACAALPTETPSLSLGRGIPPRNHRQALLQGEGHLKAMLGSPCFFIFVAGLTPPVLLSMAAKTGHAIYSASINKIKKWCEFYKCLNPSSRVGKQIELDKNVSPLTDFQFQKIPSIFLEQLKVIFRILDLFHAPRKYLNETQGLENLLLMK